MMNSFENPIIPQGEPKKTINPLEKYIKEPMSTKESQEARDKRRKGEALDGASKAIEKAMGDGDLEKARRIMENKKRIPKYDF